MLSNDLNKNPFMVPNDYFDVLPMAVQERCIAASKNRRASAAFKPHWAFATGFGALALGVASIFLMDSETQVSTSKGGNAQADYSNPYTRASSRATNYIGNMVKNSDVFTVGSANQSYTGSRDMNEIMMNQLAIENLSIDDILSAGY